MARLCPGSCTRALWGVQRRSRPQDRHLRAKTLPGARGGSILGARTNEFALRGLRNLRSRGAVPPKKDTLHVGRRRMRGYTRDPSFTGERPDPPDPPEPPGRHSVGAPRALGFSFFQFFGDGGSTGNRRFGGSRRPRLAGPCKPVGSEAAYQLDGFSRRTGRQDPKNLRFLVDPPKPKT